MRMILILALLALPSIAWAQQIDPSQPLTEAQYQNVIMQMCPAASAANRITFSDFCTNFALALDKHQLDMAKKENDDLKKQIEELKKPKAPTEEP